MNNIMSQTNSENYLDVINEKLLTHVLLWSKENKIRINPTTYRELMLASVYCHYTLNLNSEFPLSKAGQIFNWR